MSAKERLKERLQRSGSSPSLPLPQQTLKKSARSQEFPSSSEQSLESSELLLLIIDSVDYQPVNHLECPICSMCFLY